MKKKLKKYMPAQINSNTASIFYLYEVYAIPQKIRGEYLNKLIKTKNSIKLKNVKLLKIIYEYVIREDFHSWNTGEICEKIGFKNANQLYWYKSKILKDLRNMYFGWQKKEEEIENSGEYEGYKKNNDEVEMLMMKVRKMDEIGMRRESINILYRILNKYERWLEKKEPMLFSEICEYMMEYYYVQRNLILFNKFYSKLGNILEQHSVNSKLEQVEKSLLKLRGLLADASKNIFHSHSLPHLEEAKKNLEDALSITNKFYLIDYRLRILYKLKQITGYLPGTSNMNDCISKLLIKGYNAASSYSLALPKYAFESEIILRDMSGICDESEKISSLKKIYEKALYLNPINRWTYICGKNYTDILFRNKSLQYNQVYSEVLKLNILNSKKAGSILQFFNMSVGKLHVEMVAISTSKKDIIILDSQDVSILHQLELLYENTQKELKNSYNIKIKFSLLIDLLDIEFMKGMDLDFDKAFSLIRKIDRINKKWKLKKTPIGKVFELLKTGIYMFEIARKYDSEKEIIGKYLKRYSDLSDELIQGRNNNLNIGSCYLTISFVAHELRYEKLWEVTERQFLYLKKHKSQVIESLKRQLKGKKEQEAVAA